VAESVPNPGSDEAIARGCICPVLSNAHGRGVLRAGPEPEFTVDGGCQIHGIGSKPKSCVLCSSAGGCLGVCDE
jgi:hypothetical protein